MDTPTLPSKVTSKVEHAEKGIHGFLVDHSIAILRIAVGAVFLGFGILKFFPDVSPAQDLAETTFDKMSFGLVPGAWRSSASRRSSASSASAFSPTAGCASRSGSWSAS